MMTAWNRRKRHEARLVAHEMGMLFVGADQRVRAMKTQKAEKQSGVAATSFLLETGMEV